MAMAIIILKVYMLFTIAVMLVYTARHYFFTLNRLFGEQRIYYQDIVDSDLKTVSILIPMHNEEQVAAHILEQLLKTDYPLDRLEIIPINDFSEDGTEDILNYYAARYPFIRPIHRYRGQRGKSSALNEALRPRRAAA